MKWLDAYGWMTGSMSDFTKPFQENEALFNQAKAFWRNLEGWAPMLLLIGLLFGIFFAILYYGPYNNRPHRHYTPWQWALFGLINFIGCLVVTLALEWSLAKPVLDGAGLLESKIAFCNAAYAAIIYLVVSVVWCNTLPTNAFRLFKF